MPLLNIDDGSILRVRIIDACEEWATPSGIRARAKLPPCSTADLIRALDAMTQDGALRCTRRYRWPMYRATDDGLFEAIRAEQLSRGATQARL